MAGGITKCVRIQNTGVQNFFDESTCEGKRETAIAMVMVMAGGGPGVLVIIHVILLFLFLFV